MKTENLIIEANLYPTSSQELLKYFDVLEDYINKIIGCNLEWNQDLKKTILESFSYLLNKLSFFKNNIDGDIDLIAWFSRSFLELYFLLRYAFKSDTNVRELLDYPINELTDIDKAIYEKGKPEKMSEEDELFRKNLHTVLEKVKSAGIIFNKELSISKKIAEESGLLNYYEVYYKLHSKYVHPTPYLLFGEKKFVYSSDALIMFRSLALHFVSVIIKDTIEFLENNSVNV